MQDRRIFLCPLSDLEELDTKGFQIIIKRKKTDIFIVRKGNAVYAYQNSCPHAKAPLEWNPDEFLDAKKEVIICAMHGATFSIEKGECLQGACSGIGLKTLSTAIQEGNVYIV